MSENEKVVKSGGNTRRKDGSTDSGGDDRHIGCAR